MIKSIRLSLILYFLVLLALALGIAFVLVYRTAVATTLEKKAATEELIHAEYRDHCRQEETHLNDSLLFQGLTLARLAQFQTSWDRVSAMRLTALGAIPASAAPYAHFTTM